LEELANGTASVRSNYPAWFVEVGVDRIVVAMQGSGIDPLSGLRRECKPCALPIRGGRRRLLTCIVRLAL
jgi:hypothetical protein